MSTRFDTYEEAYYFASTRANETGLANGIERTTEFGKDGFNVRFLPRPDKRFGWELRCETVEPGSPVLYDPSLGSMSQADLAHERRMLKRQLRRAGVEWDRDLPNTAEALRDQIRALGLEPMEVCFYRSIECPACVLPAGHEGPHEPTSARTLESLSDYQLLDGRYRKREGIRAEQLRRAALVKEKEKVRRAAGDIATAEQLAALASDLEAGVRNSPKVSIGVPAEPKKSVRKSTVNAPDLSLFD